MYAQKIEFVKLSALNGSHVKDVFAMGVGIGRGGSELALIERSVDAGVDRGCVGCGS